ncbi:hypothetical protein [Nocardioides sp.]|uniref:NACHT domain-containing protein n=1 Tax=Nocardioides sp. TaxID=35761 RepID=UPI002BD360CA|nr:hypothetical protein [Nocardioides sp.]HSX66181.1 hypothetical protein [Nocardioides sp.]
MQHDLDRLGSQSFQDLAAALVVAEFGPSVQILGAGRDGGRDMYFNGALNWPTQSEPEETLDGYTVFQVKKKDRRAEEPHKNAAWLWGEIRSELELWADPEKRRNPIPDNLVFITNVPLSPDPDAGGLATIQKYIASYVAQLATDKYDVTDGAERRAKLGRIEKIKTFRIWEGNQVDAMVSAHGAVRRAFAALLTAADVFAHLADFTDRLPLDKLEEGLRAHARSALIGERTLYFDDAGAVASGTPIETVAIDLDLEAGPDGDAATLFGHVLAQGERVLRPRLGLHSQRRHIVVAGGPGNGKTTFSKFLVQIYRAAFLDGAPHLSAEHQEAIEGTRERLASLGLALPHHRRWPIRIDLGEYVEEGGLSEDATLLRWIAHKVSKQSNLGDVTPSALDSWRRQWPWFVVLDGLDEVTEPQTRKRLISQIATVAADADGDNCDLLLVVTTRPTGYVEAISPNLFQRVDLARLTPAQALAYGRHVTRVRLGADAERIEDVEKQLTKASKDEALLDLMQTPLQVLIMTIIAEHAGRLAPDRYGLFWGYYETVLKREKGKSGSLSGLIKDWSPQITRLHERIGFELQAHSENADGSAAIISLDRVRAVAWKVLHESGLDPSSGDADLLDSIVQAATHRLVLLAPHGDQGLGFDVRQLQELMAGRYLTTGTVDRVIERLRRAAPSPHWRFAWLFAAGRYFAEPQDHQHEAIVALVESLDDSATDRLGSLCPVGPDLALGIIDDGMAAPHPAFQRRILARACGALRQPLLTDRLSVARALMKAADSRDDLRKQIGDAMRLALNFSPSARNTVEGVQSRISGLASSAPIRTDASMLAGVKTTKGGFENEPDPAWWLERREQFLHYAAGESWESSAIDAAAELGFMYDGVWTPTANLVALMSLADGAYALEASLADVSIHAPQLAAGLRDEVLAEVARQPIGDSLT